jgi:hypothetical protein
MRRPAAIVSAMFRAGLLLAFAGRNAIGKPRVNWSKGIGFCVLTGLSLSTALADTWADGTISEIRVISTGTASNDGIVVLGTFSPSLGCTNSGFMLFAGDPYFNQSYAALLTAQANGSHVRFLNWYCMPNGYARANGYSIVP